MMLALIEAVFYVTLRVPNMIISMGIVMVYEAVSGLLNNGLGVNFFANDTEYTQELLQNEPVPSDLYSPHCGDGSDLVPAIQDQIRL